MYTNDNYDEGKTPAERDQYKAESIQYANLFQELSVKSANEIESLHAQLKAAYEQCAVICDEEANEWDSDNVICDKNYAAAAAQRIRSLSAPILTQQSPVTATDERTNEFGEPETVYLQLHDPDDGNEKSHGSNYKADGVTWCWHPINENDVRYIRADLFQQSPAVAVPADIQALIDSVRKWGIENTGNEPSISCFHRSLDELVGALSPSPRITEQDVLVILEAYFTWNYKREYADTSYETWLKMEGSKLLAKLNKE